MRFIEYAGTGPEADAIIAECRAKQEELAGGVRVLMDYYGCSDVYFDHGHIPLLLFAAPQGASYLRFVKMIGDKLAYTAGHRLDERSVQLAKDLARPEFQYNESDFIIEKIGMDCYALDGEYEVRKYGHDGVKTQVMSPASGYKSTAWYAGDTIRVRVPVGSQDCGPLPTPPAWLKEKQE